MAAAGTGGQGADDGAAQRGRAGEPPGVVLSATTSVRLPGTLPQRVFDYLRDEQRRGDWDILANGEAMQEMDHIAKGQHHGNAVSLLRPNVSFFHLPTHENLYYSYIKKKPGGGDGDCGESAF